MYKIAFENSLEGYEIFMFTDNSTAEAAFCKGTSSSPLLFELVLELKRLEVESDLILHVIHVSGKRMIAQGTDGLSRADHLEGVMQGKPIENFIPLHLNAFEREKGLSTWVGKITNWVETSFPCTGGLVHNRTPTGHVHMDTGPCECRSSS